MNDINRLYDIRIDKEGTWYFRGAEMFRREIVNYFYENLKMDTSGRYLIELPGDRCFVEVEDKAFVVKTVLKYRTTPDDREVILITLSDDSQEILDPVTLRIGRDNVLYCSIKNGAFEARFSRPGYYQLTGHVECDADSDAYFLRLNGQRFYIHNHPI
jgi:uncharacterized protein